MSTKPIREALTKLKRAVDMASPNKGASEHDDAYAAALEAVRAIEEMARKVLASGRVDHPAMREEEALLESIAKEAP